MNIPVPPTIPGDSNNSTIRVNNFASIAGTIKATNSLIIPNYAEPLPTTGAIAVNGSVLLDTTTGNLAYYYGGGWNQIISG